MSDEKWEDRVEKKLDTLIEKQTEHTIVLEAHHRRTTNLEERVAPIETYIVAEKAVKDNNVFWWGTVIALVGAFEGIHALFKYLEGHK
jgi:hypothetical protein